MVQQVKKIDQNRIPVDVPDELVQHVMTETQVCGKYVTVRAAGGYVIHHLAKLMGFWLLLKASSPGSSLIQDYTGQIPELSRNFNISPRTFFTYMKRLEAMGLLTRQDKNIKVATWNQLGRVFNINTQKRTTIKFDYDEKQKIHWWFAALEIEDNGQRCAYMINKKMNKNSGPINSLRTALNRRGFDTSRSNDLPYLIERLQMLYVEDFRTGTEVHDIIIRLRPDVNRSCDGIAKAWNTSRTVVNYWKAQMQKQKIIAVSKFETIFSEWQWDRQNCGKNELYEIVDGKKRKLVHIFYSKKEKQRALTLCQQIDIIKRWEWLETREFNEALGGAISA